MKLKMTHIYLQEYTLDVLVRMLIGGALREDGASPKQLAVRLRWNVNFVQKLLASGSPADVDGADAASITIADFESKSPLRARHAAEDAIVKSLVQSLDARKCNRLIARMLGVGEWRVRRIRKRAGFPSARQITKSRVLAKPSSLPLELADSLR